MSKITMPHQPGYRLHFESSTTHPIIPSICKAIVEFINALTNHDEPKHYTKTRKMLIQRMRIPSGKANWDHNE